MNNLRPFQVKGVNHLTSGARRLLLDDPGLGKTAQAVAAMTKLGATRSLVICPAATRYSWADEVTRWSGGKLKPHVVLKTTEWLPDDPRLVIIMSYNTVLSPMIHRQLMERRWPVVVVDEIHFCANPKSKRTKLILGAKGLIAQAVYLWGLTGTPMTNRPIDLWPMLAAMAKADLAPYDNWFKYTGRYCQRYKAPWGVDVSGASNVEELGEKMFRRVALRRCKEDVLPELPARAYRFVTLEPKKRISRHWDESLNIDDIAAGKGSGADLMRMRYEVGMEKLGQVIEYILYVLETEKSVVVFAWHKDVVRILQIALLLENHQPVMYYGDTSTADKEKAKRDFIEGRANVFIANIVAAGTGMDGLQKACSHAIYAEVPWTYTGIMQSTDRLWRMGQTRGVISDIVTLKGSVEDRVLRAIFQKKEIQERLLTSG